MRFSIIVIALFSCFLMAEEEVKPLSLLEKIAQPKLTLQSAFLSDAKFKGYEGSVQTYKQKVQINNDIVGFSYTHWDFDWNQESSLPFYKNKTPIDTMQGLKFFVNLPIPISDKLFMLNSININATYEKEFEDSLGGGVFSFLSYKLGADHAIQFGAFANYHPVSTLALPILGYSYRARENSGLTMVLGFPRAYVGYYLNSKLLMNAGMIYSQAVIRLADESGIEAGGYSEAKDYQSNVGLRYTLNQHFELTADILYAFRRDFIIYDKNQRQVDTYSIEPSLGASLRLKYLF